MDIKVSQKEEMMQPKGTVDVITSGITDFFLIESTDENGQMWIDDIEEISDSLEEEQDRVIFAVIRQRGQDPIKPNEGIQWSEALINEIPIPLLMQQVVDAAAAESNYINVSFDTVTVDGKQQLSVNFSITTI